MNSASRTTTAEYTQNLNTYQENQYLQQQMSENLQQYNAVLQDQERTL